MSPTTPTPCANAIFRGTGSPVYTNGGLWPGEAAPTSRNIEVEFSRAVADAAHLHRPGGPHCPDGGSSRACESQDLINTLQAPPLVLLICPPAPPPTRYLATQPQFQSALPSCSSVFQPAAPSGREQNLIGRWLGDVEPSFLSDRLLCALLPTPKKCFMPSNQFIRPNLGAAADEVVMIDYLNCTRSNCTILAG